MEQQKFEETLGKICTILDQEIASVDIKDMQLRKKLFALSAFSEFLKAGADVKSYEIQNRVARYDIILK
jgi:hypothetical protein